MMQATLKKELHEPGAGLEDIEAARKICVALKGPPCGDGDLQRVAAGRPDVGKGQ
jgi:hypothetical protein